MIKDSRVIELTDKKKKDKDKWWKKDKKQVEEVQLTEEELLQIEKSIDQIFEEEKQKVASFVRPLDSIENRFEFVFRGGSMKITNQDKEGIIFKYDEMNCIYEQEQSGFTNSNFQL